MRATRRAISIAACLLAAAHRGTAAQQTAGDSTRSTLAGVYAADQAAQGQEIYELTCRSCHLPVTHTGPAFVAAWQGRPLWDLFRYIKELMPQNDPGILSPRETTRVLAYLLRMNGMPPGPDELAADSTTLSRIRIELKGAHHPGER
jgi:mono/diheme cytochrome c family protein